MLRGAQALIFAALAWLVQPRLRLRRTMLFLGVDGRVQSAHPGRSCPAADRRRRGHGGGSDRRRGQGCKPGRIDVPLAAHGRFAPAATRSGGGTARLEPRVPCASHGRPCAFRPAPSCPEPRPGIALCPGRRTGSATGRWRFRHDDAAGRDVRGRAACARRRSARLEPPPRLIRDGVRLCGTLSPRRAERCRERERRRDAGSRETGATAGRRSPAQAGKATAGDLHGSGRAPGGVAACPGSRGAAAGEPSRGGSGKPAARPHQRPSDAGAARSGGYGQAGGRGRGRGLPRSAARLRRGTGARSGFAPAGGCGDRRRGARRWSGRW